MQRIIIILLFLGTLNLSAQDREGFKNIDVATINEEIKNSEVKMSLDQILNKYCTYIPKDYVIDGNDSYHYQEFQSLKTLDWHITDLEHPLLQEIKIYYKITNKDGFYQFIKLQESYLCIGATNWSREACE
ncbi:hypothetical protein JCM19297_2763 [Nonlabens ulvanivorans]|nr:hypothetical protein [Nonlabens ulvanivorans]GAK88250.1 hypothetical protein JCM19297_2763 [Nonlabens ulvanivorans]